MTTHRRERRYRLPTLAVPLLLLAMALLVAACGEAAEEGAAETADADAEAGAEDGDDGSEDGEDQADEGDEAEAGGAEDFPSGPVTIIIITDPGGAHDTINRLLADELQDVLGVEVVVENLPGGGGVRAKDELWDRPPDGHTVMTNSPPGDYLAELSGDPYSWEDFTMIGATNVDPAMLAVPLDSPYETLEEFNEYALETAPTVSTSRWATNTVVASLGYFDALGADVEIVPNEGGSALTATLVGGHTDAGMRVGGFYDLHGEELRVLGVGSEERVDELPDVPTFQEAGVDYTFEGMRGLAVRSDTPDEIVQALSDAYEEAANRASFRDTFFEETGFRWQFFPADDALERTLELNEKVDAVQDRIEFNE